MKKIERQLKRLQQLMTVLIGRDHFKGIFIDKADKKNFTLESVNFSRIIQFMDVKY